MGKVFTITAGLENMGALKTGGQGSVYKGRRTGEIITAVKLLPTPIHSESPEDKHYAAFLSEVTKLKKVNEQPNPNVVRILSSGLTESGSFPYIEMEFVEGPDLEELLRPPHGPVFTVKEAVRLADQLSNALAHCHRVGVKHGDLKSNNVKYNVHTGNYVLLDFGLAIMSDEQRRTSLRHAGAIEFMAPEQNEGRILFPTDVYSFGVILFELLAGQVPFPLKDRGETMRTQVMLAHMETPPPDLMELRRAALPADWPEEKKQRELQVPQWLIDTVYICLQKDPERRFKDGVMLHDHIILRSTHKTDEATTQPVSDIAVARLQQENARLQEENRTLRQQLEQVQQFRRETAATAERRPFAEPTPPPPPPPPVRERRRGRTPWLSWIIVLGVLGLVAWIVIGRPGIGGRDTETGATTEPGPDARPIGQFMVKSARAYFYNEPDAGTRREAYMVPSTDVVTGLREENGYIYTDFTNDRGQRSKGWLRRRDLMTMDEWNARQRQQPEPQKPKLTPEEIRNQLETARRQLEGGQVEEATFVYRYLAEQEVPEAMYEYGNLGLQKRAAGVDCGKSWGYVQKAADKGHVPAKRTLGLLYVFADNPEVLRINNYENCFYERNVYKGTRLLMEAVAGGDTTARRLVDELSLNSGGNPDPQNPQP
ncbi:protein kinase domain-containing protein [Flaviaesturariibacter amylovorans]|uniref:Protein kinase domain-containing protein n=1 Tax=Flaviaesturariibacter amylovorans TaxID=1084520 RepID=A0ABP8GJS9_9BACT